MKSKKAKSHLSPGYAAGSQKIAPMTDQGRAAVVDLEEDAILKKLTKERKKGMKVVEKRGVEERPETAGNR